MQAIRKGLLWKLVFLSLFLLILITPQKSQAQEGGQSVVVSCLDVTRNYTEAEIDGQNQFGHFVDLQNNSQGVFQPDTPIYLLRNLPRTFCNPADGDPECLPIGEGVKTPCIQEKVGEGICNERCPWFEAGSPDCIDQNDQTVCCMDAYAKQGSYWECAEDKNGVVVCPTEVMEPTAGTSSINKAEAGHIETGWESKLKIYSKAKDEIFAGPDGEFSLNLVDSYTRAGLDHAFYGLQILDMSGLENNTEALTRALKLATFTPAQGLEPANTNCITIFWDPYGKIIDSLYLEPVKNTTVTLKNLNNNEQVVKTTVPNNPFFVNPFNTDPAGMFNFAVEPGTYFLFPYKDGFLFPPNNSNVNNALSRLAVIDPEQKYFKRDLLYADSNEPIIEKAGKQERRDIIIDPTDTNYSGSPAEIVYAQNTRDKNIQTITGRVSHPNAIVKALIKGEEVAQTSADITGAFSLLVPEVLITDSVDKVDLVVEKMSLIAIQKDTVLKRLARLITTVTQVEAVENKHPYSVSLIPTQMSGFIFNQKLETIPNAKVEIVIPSMGNLTYFKTRADKDGFFALNNNSLPPFGFALKITPPEKQSQAQIQTVSQFRKTNIVYFSETNNSLYRSSSPAYKPNSEVIEKIKTETPQTVPSSVFLANSTPQQNPITNSTIPPEDQITPAKNTNKNLFIILFVLLVTLISAALIVLKIKRKTI